MAKVLVVDDEPDVINLVAFIFRKSGHEVLTAGDGWTALTQARLNVPEVIILDVMLPEMDGFTVCEILRREQATADVPIILLTARSSELCRVIGLDAGANDYITKPFSPHDLERRVESLRRRR